MIKLLNRKLLTLIMILQLVILIFSALKIKNASGQERTIKILSLDDSTSITLGSETEPLPQEGIQFTIKIVLEGTTKTLNTFQVGLKFDNSTLNCTNAWVPKDDPSFVFYGKAIYEVKSINRDCIMVGAILQIQSDYVDVSGINLLAYINFTTLKPGTTTITFYPEELVTHQYTFLLDNYAMDITYTEGEPLSINILSAKTPPVASFTYSPKNKITVYQTLNISQIQEILTNPINSNWSGAYSYTCVDWFDYEPKGLSKRDILYMMDMTGLNSTWLVHDIKLESNKITLILWSWSNLTVVFDASRSYDPDGTIEKFIWDFGDGNVNETQEKIFNHIYENRGFYFVNLTVIDNDNASSSTGGYVLIGYPPKAVFVIASPAGYPEEAILPDETVVAFNATESIHPENITITSYVWDFGDGNVTETSDPLITHVYEKRGVYSINLTVIDIDGLQNSEFMEIQVGNPPIAVFTFDPQEPHIISVEEGVEVYFDASQSEGGEYDAVPITRYVWDFDDGNTAEVNETGTSHVFLTQGDWNVTLTVYDEDGLRSSFTATVPVTSTSVEESSFPTHVVVIIVIIVVIVAAVIINKRRTAEKEEALEI